MALGDPLGKARELGEVVDGRNSGEVETTVSSNGLNQVGKVTTVHVIIIA